jgi:class 3 adenylate cyclase
MTMRLRQTESETTEEPRYGIHTLRKVAKLATRLQRRRDQEALTAGEVESIGAEAGLEPAAIREALAQLAREQPRLRQQRVRKAELWPPVAAYSIVLLWTILAIFCQHTRGWFDLVTVYSPVLFAGLLGFLIGKQKAAFAVGALLILALTPPCFEQACWIARPMLKPDDIPPAIVGFAFVILYAGIGVPVVGWIAQQSARVREYQLTISSAKEPITRPGLLNLLFTLQRRLEGQKQRRTFLSVDVVGSSEMKRSANELAVEHSFGQYRAWVEEVVRAQGGEMQSAAGDGVMAIFPSDASAVRTARHLQEELACCNQTHNRLPLPFRIRCGVSAGEVAMEEGTPLGHLQSPVIDRAAALQKRAVPGDIIVSQEVAGAALVELGTLAPLAEPIAGEPAFSWKAGGRADASMQKAQH